MLGGALAVVGAAGAISWLVFLSGDSARPPKAAIIDQLSLTTPNPEFLEQAGAMLEPAGYTVDYYEGEQVTVDFFRDLPTRGYDLLIFRVHGARNVEAPEEETALFTGEPYSDRRYLEDQRNRRLAVAYYEPQDVELGPAFFAIPPPFVRASMKGEFGGAVVVLMGCDVLRGEALAAAFVDRGASAVIGWNDEVSAAHTDAATERLLEHLVRDGQPPQQAVATTMAELGPDPAFGAELLAYTAGE